MRALIDWYLRHRAALHKTPLDRYQVRIARSVSDYEDAFRLLHVAYVYEGLEPVKGSDLRITAQHVLPESTVFVAYEDEQVVGTITITLDSPAGLPLERDYPEQISALRARGARLVEYGSLAVVRRCWRSGVTALMNMAVYWFIVTVLRASHAVIGVNPRVAAHYRALYNFHPLGPAQRHAELAAPVMGLIQDMSTMQAWINAKHRRKMSSGLRVAEHFTDQPPPGVELPPVQELTELVRWKLPREVFQAVFIERSDRLHTLDPRTREYLHTWRSIKTTLTRDGAITEAPESKQEKA